MVLSLITMYAGERTRDELHVSQLTLQMQITLDCPTHKKLLKFLKIGGNQKEPV